jgi:hypothetical protein
MGIRYYVCTGLFLASFSGCGGTAPPPASPEGSLPTNHHDTAMLPAEPPKNFSQQVAAGQALYVDNCAHCHGDAGQGVRAPAVVGLSSGALPLEPPANAKYRKTQFRTVADVADFVTKNMPPNKAGTLTEAQYFSILAFDLKANGIDLGDKMLDGALAPTLTIPRP